MSGETRSCATRLAKASSSWLRRSSSAHLLLDGVLLAAEHPHHRGAHRHGEDATAPSATSAPTKVVLVRRLSRRRRRARVSCASLWASSPASALSCSVMGRSSASRCWRARSASRRLLKRSATRADWASAWAVSSKRLPQLLLAVRQTAGVRQSRLLRVGERLLHARVGQLPGVVGRGPDVIVDQVLQHRGVHPDAGDERLTLERGTEELVDAGVGPQLVPQREGRHRGQQSHDGEEGRAVAAKGERSVQGRGRHGSHGRGPARP